MLDNMQDITYAMLANNTFSRAMFITTKNNTENITLTTCSKNSVKDTKKNFLFPHKFPRKTEYTVENTSVGMSIRSIDRHLWSVKRLANKFLKISTTEQRIIEVVIPITSPAQITEFSPFLSFRLALLAVLLLITSGSPLETIVSSTINIENAIWYTPTPSAPIVRERNILNKNPSDLVSIENEDSIASALKSFFKDKLLFVF